MADAKITELTPIDAVAGGDLIPIVDDPAGTPATKSATASQIKDYIIALANTWTATQTIDPADNTSALVVSGFSLTGSNAQSILDLAGTWDTTGTPTAIKLNVTETGSGSNAASLLMDLQVGGSRKFSINKDGEATGLYLRANGGYIYFAPAGTSNAYLRGASGQLWAPSSLTAGISLGLASGFSPADVLLTRKDAANLRLGAADAATAVAQTLSVQSVAAGQTNVAGANLTITGSQGTGTGAGGKIIFQVAPAGSSGTSQNSLVTFLEATSARAFNLYNTADVTTNYERGKIAWESNVLRIGTEKAGTGTARALELQTDGTTRLTIASTSGDVTTTGSVTTAAPAGGTAAAWKLGVAATVSPSSPNRTIEVDIGGTIYYIHAKTTND